MNVVDRTFVARWERRYEVNDIEEELLTTVGQSVARAGFYTKTDLAKVAEWKSPRVRRRIERNAEADVKEVTQLALAAPDHLKHRILGLLDGVGDPVASAILTIWNPQRYTVLDVRVVTALDALHESGAIAEVPPPHVKGALPDYPAYLQCCRTLAHRLRVGLRDLDRALWQWNKEGMPQA
jgi:hypothetical protein